MLLNKILKQEMKIKIFEARQKHVKDILKLINELADFEKLEPPR